MIKPLIWYLTAVITVGGETQEARLDVFERPGECGEARKLVKDTMPANVTLECIGWDHSWDGYNSQPSWMTDEMAENLRKKQGISK